MAPSLKLLHLASKKKQVKLWSEPFHEALSQFGNVSIFEDTQTWSDSIVANTVRQHDVLICNWGSRRLPLELAEDPGQLRYICNLTGEVRPFVPRELVAAGLLLTNWGTLPADGIGEGALALLLASLRNFIPSHNTLSRGKWVSVVQPNQGTVKGLRLGIYGLGAIGQGFLDRVIPLQPRLAAYDPFLKDWPDGVMRMDSLASLFDFADAVVVTAALTVDTRNSVNSGMLARLPDGGVVVNVGRGGIIQQEDLLNELGSGRLRAGLDVLDCDGRDSLPDNHPALSWPNLILTGHSIGNCQWNDSLEDSGVLKPIHEICLSNLRNFVSGKPLQYSFNLERYDQST